MPEDWVYDQKGWTVFTQEGDKRRELEPDGSGGFSALQYPGQTVYFSRVMEEDLESPILRLPVLDCYRDDVRMTLPQDYVGKTLTIAQSGESEIEGGRVYPCVMTLFCGYTYESGLISESFQTAIPSALAFAAGAALLGLALWRAARGKLDPTLICGAFAAFLYESSSVRLIFPILP